MRKMQTEKPSTTTNVSIQSPNAHGTSRWSYHSRRADDFKQSNEPDSKHCSGEWSGKHRHRGVSQTTWPRQIQSGAHTNRTKTNYGATTCEKCGTITSGNTRAIDQTESRPKQRKQRRSTTSTESTMRCEGVTKSGERCKRYGTELYCWQHS